MLNCGSSSRRGDIALAGLAVRRGQWFSFIQPSRIYWHSDHKRGVGGRHLGEALVRKNLCRVEDSFLVWFAVDSNQQAAVLGRRIVTGICRIADKVTGLETGPVAFGQIPLENQEFFLS